MDLTLPLWLLSTLALLVASRGLAALTRLPLPTVQLLLGAAAGLLVTSLEVDSGLRWQTFHDLVVYVLLPLLIFNAATTLEWNSLKRHMSVVLLLAVVGVLITTSLVAVAVYLGIGHPTGFPWEAALITGVLLAATDPAAVTSQAQTSRAAEILEGESLFNDGTAVALFTVLVGLAAGSLGGFSSALELGRYAGTVFAMEFVGGALFGGAAGLFMSFLLRRISDTSVRRWVLLFTAFAVYYASINLHVSGIISVLISGLVIGRNQHHDDFFHTLDQTANGFLFTLAGFTITWSMFTDRWLAMLIGIGAVMLARALSTGLILNLAGRQLQPRLNLKEQTVISVFGLRGAVTLALVLTLPVELPYWWTVQSIVYGVVVFDFLVLAPLTPIFANPR